MSRSAARTTRISPRRPCTAIHSTGSRAIGVMLLPSATTWRSTPTRATRPIIGATWATGPASPQRTTRIAATTATVPSRRRTNGPAGTGPSSSRVLPTPRTTATAKTTAQRRRPAAPRRSRGPVTVCATSIGSSSPPGGRPLRIIAPRWPCRHPVQLGLGRTLARVDRTWTRLGRLLVDGARAVAARRPHRRATAAPRPRGARPAARADPRAPRLRWQAGYPGDFTGTARVEYAPRGDDRADPGEVVWGWVPYEEDHSRGKDRPALVVGRDGRWVLALMLTSRDHDADPRAGRRQRPRRLARRGHRRVGRPRPAERGAAGPRAAARPRRHPPRGRPARARGVRPGGRRAARPLRLELNRGRHQRGGLGDPRPREAGSGAGAARWRRLRDRSTRRRCCAGRPGSRLGRRGGPLVPSILACPRGRAGASPVAGRRPGGPHRPSRVPQPSPTCPTVPARPAADQ